MTKPRKVFLGILSLLPLALLVVYLILSVRLFFSMVSNLLEIEDGIFPTNFFFTEMLPSVILAIVMTITNFGLLIFFIIHVVNNRKIDSNERLIWILVLIFAGMVGFPVYWYMRIWKDVAPQPSTQQ
jgi:Phospholipase_D-nuclease N-terminal